MGHKDPQKIFEFLVQIHLQIPQVTLEGVTTQPPRTRSGKRTLPRTPRCFDAGLLCVVYYKVKLSMGKSGPMMLDLSQRVVRNIDIMGWGWVSPVKSSGHHGHFCEISWKISFLGGILRKPII